MSRLKDRICISYLLVLYLNLLQCCIVEMYITSFTLLPLFRTLCLFINRPTLTSYIRKYKFSIFLPWKCSICFCFIACHNSLSFLFYPQPFFFMDMTAIYLIMHPYLRFIIGISPCFVQILLSSEIHTLSFYIPPLPSMFLCILKTHPKGKLILC